MKKTISILILFFLVITSGKLNSQSKSEITPNAIFDTVYDHYGTRYQLANLMINSGRTISGATVSSIPMATCSSGYFNLYFEPFTLWTSNPAFQTVLCQVCQDISNFLPSPLTNTLINPNGFKINIYCGNVTGVLMDASQFYVFPSNATNPNQGIIDGQVYKSILSGVDPYLNIPSTYSNSGQFYHGRIGLNPNTSFPWNTSMTVAPIGVQYDAYGTMLHELTHALGFASLIDYTGYSRLGQNNNMFSRYDQFLYDASGNPLLSSSTPTCSNSNIAFTSSLSLSTIAPSSCTAAAGSALSLPNCSVTPQYSSTNVNVKIVTPLCYVLGTSLSHFEDMCSTSSFTPVNSTLCTPTPSSPGCHNLYFLMSAGAQTTTASWSCDYKRYLKEEERKVLCDLGYAVNSYYLCGATGAVIDGSVSSHVYSAGSCSSVPIIGNNDGIVNNSYTYSTTGSSFSVSLSSLLSNDIPSTGLSVSCVEVVYTNNITNVAASTPGSSLVVTATAGSGLAIIKYLPKDASGRYGNATYVFVYFLSGNCNPINSCDFVQNGGFETLISATMSPQCGILGTTLPYNSVSCWEPLSGNPSLLTRSCTSNTVYNLGNNTIGSSPNIINSFNGNGYGNDHVVALNYNYNDNFSPALKNNLGSALIPGTVYDLSFMVNNSPSSTTGNNTVNSPVVVTIASSQVFNSVYSNNFPAGLNVIAQFTIAASTSWSNVTQTFTFSSLGSVNHHALLIGINGAQTQSLGVLTASTGVWCYLDEISLISQPSPSFVINPLTICGNQSYPNLVQYAGSAGTFTGQNVTYNAGQYNFNLNSVLPPGNYPIAYTYTASGCVHTKYQMITINTNTNLLVLNPAGVCISSPTFDLSTLITNTNYISGTTFNVNGSTVTPIYTFSALGIYTITASNTSTSLCNNYTPSTTVGVYSTPAVPTILSGTTSVTSSDLCIGNASTFSASTTGSFATWQPGALNGYSQTLSPTVTTIYTVSVYDYSTCASSQTLAVVLFTNCCNSVIVPTFTSTSISGVVNSPGPLLITSDFTVQSGGWFVMSQAYLFKPGVKGTIANGGEITLDGAHLSACDNTMWHGMVVQNGGQIVCQNTNGKDNLIEDAELAIDVSNNTTSTLSSIMFVSQTTFNKNAIDINISNYTRTVTPYPFFVLNNVFTCRDFNLPVGGSSWPQTGTVSSVSTASADLRYVSSSTPTTGLFSPYLNQSTFSITTLKSPYSGQPSNIAIQISSVGITSGTVMYDAVIGSTNAAQFNVFDAHGEFISALESHISSINNVFQNTQTYTVLTGTATSTVGGSAISHSIGSIFNSRLILNGANTSSGNRFWNCHIGVNATKVYSLTVVNALFRSTQSSANTGTFLPGNTGINANTNRFTYYITNNEFTNVQTGINIPLSAGSFTQAGTSFTIGLPGVYADRLRIFNNLFTGSVSGQSGSYMNDGVVITEPLTIPWYVIVNNTVTPVVNAVAVTNNTVTQVLRFANLNGVRGFPSLVNNNSVTLKDGGTNFGTQHAIRLTNCNPANVLTGYYGKSVIANNTASFTSQPTNTTVNNALIWCGLNGYSLLSPSVSCNNLSQAHIGFVFEGPNLGTLWAGNQMHPMDMGFVLTASSKIGVQGGSTLSNDNTWNGSWSTPQSQTYVYNSTPSLSSLWVDASTSGQPTINNSLLSSQDYNQMNCIQFSSGADYQCNDFANFRSVILPDSATALSTRAYYIDKLELYELLALNDSVRNSDPSISDFYADQTGTTIDKFWQVENFLFAGNYSNASSVLSGLSLHSTDTVAQNYYNFYTIYAAYLQYGTLTSTQKSNLLSLANGCPGKDGACVYQAVALYNTIYNQVIYPSCQENGSARIANFAEGSNAINSSWNVSLYPNPATNKLTIASTTASEELQLTIHDLGGRIMGAYHLKTSDFIAKLDLSLLNGAYFVTIENNFGKRTVKKLIIAK